MSYFSQEIGGYANDSGCSGCGQPMVSDLRSQCQACLGEAPPTRAEILSRSWNVQSGLTGQMVCFYGNERAARRHAARFGGRVVPPQTQVAA